MSESEIRLRHLPFFEEIAASPEGSARWKAATAGLVVLRLVDAWLEHGPTIAADDGWSVRGVRAAIAEVDFDGATQVLLSRVLEALHEARPDIHVVITPLMAYAQSLEYAASWHLASDVYHSVLAHLHPVQDSDASIAAHLRLGQCYRNLNRVDDAAAAFASASDIATEVGDFIGVLKARVGEGRVAMLRGNLPKAESILDGTIAKAIGPEFREVRYRALHERSNVAFFRKQYDRSIQYAYQALGHAQTPIERDRVLSDIAVAFMELGVYDAARDAYVVLSKTAQEQYTRWAATINLVEIAGRTGMELLFEAYRRELVPQKLPPYLATSYEVILGNGFRRFGRIAEAQTHLQRAMALSAEHNLNQLLFEAEEALLELETPRPPIRPREKISLEVEEVANAIRNLRAVTAVS